MKFQMLGDANHAGPVRLSDVYSSQVGDASTGIAASQKALYDAYSSLNSSKASTSALDAVRSKLNYCIGTNANENSGFPFAVCVNSLLKGQTVTFANAWLTFIVITTYAGSVGAWLVIPRGNIIVALGSQLTSAPFTCTQQPPSITFSNSHTIRATIYGVGTS